MFKGMKINEVLESLEELDYGIIEIGKYSDGEIFSVVYHRPEIIMIDGYERICLSEGYFDCYFENGVCESESRVLED